MSSEQNDLSYKEDTAINQSTSDQRHVRNDQDISMELRQFNYKTATIQQNKRSMSMSQLSIPKMSPVLKRAVSENLNTNSQSTVQHTTTAEEEAVESDNDQTSPPSSSTGSTETESSSPSARRRCCCCTVNACLICVGGIIYTIVFALIIIGCIWFAKHIWTTLTTQVHPTAAANVQNVTNLTSFLNNTD